MFHQILCGSAMCANPYFEFTVGSTSYASGYRIFGSQHSAGSMGTDGIVAKWWRMEINGKPSDQPIENPKLQSGDVVRVYHNGTGGVFVGGFHDFVKDVRGALPALRGRVTAEGAFTDCRDLTTVPVELFANARGIEVFADKCFQRSGITSLPKGIFSNMTLERLYGRLMFSECQSLASIDINEFANVKSIYSMDYMFSDSAVRNLHLRFTVQDVESEWGLFRFADGLPDGAITVYCPKGSNFAKRMKADNPNVTVVEE